MFLQKKLSKIKDIFNVEQGIRSGNNEIFKLSDGKYSILNHNDKKYFRPVVENESIKDGFLIAKNYIWYPYEDKGLIFLTEESLSNQVSNFYESYLLPNKESLSKRAGITVWWELTRPRNSQFERKRKLISTEYGNSSSFAIDNDGTFVVERGNAWYPKKIMTIDDYYFYLSLFSSPFFDKLLSIYSKQLVGVKSYDLGKKHTNEIPIPDVHLSEIRNSSPYRKMVELGKSLSDGDSYVKSVLDDEVCVFYPQNLI